MWFLFFSSLHKNQKRLEVRDIDTVIMCCVFIHSTSANQDHWFIPSFISSIQNRMTGPLEMDLKFICIIWFLSNVYSKENLHACLSEYLGQSRGISKFSRISSKMINWVFAKQRDGTSSSKHRNTYIREPGPRIFYF